MLRGGARADQRANFKKLSSAAGSQGTNKTH